MKKRNFDADFDEEVREPIFRKRKKGFVYKDEEVAERKRKKSGKRFHRRPTPKDGFGVE